MIPLYRPARNRLGDVLLALVILVVGLGFLLFMAVIVIAVAGNVWGYLVALGLGSIALLLIGTAVKTIVQSFKGTPCLRLFPDGLEIDHPLRFRRPFRVPKDRIRSVIVDVMHTPNPDLGEMAKAVWSADRKPRPRLPVIGMDRLDPAAARETTLEGFLYSKSGSPLPLVLTEAKDLPNLAVIFDEPLVLSTARRGYLNSATGLTSVTLDLNLPDPKRPAPGFLARAVDPGKAYGTFDAWGILPKSEAEARDVIHVFPTRDERARERAKRVGAWVAVFAAAMLVRLVAENVS